MGPAVRAIAERKSLALFEETLLDINYNDLGVEYISHRPVQSSVWRSVLELGPRTLEDVRFKALN